MRKFCLITLFCFTAAASSTWDADGEAWWKHVEYLASNELMGRDVGTHGFDLAANYVAAQYERTGLRAAGDDGYFQKIWFMETSLVWANIRIQRSGRWVDIPLPGEAVINFNSHSYSKMQGPVVFAGYGLKIPEADYDDLKGLPLKGAIVAYLTGGPEEIAGNLRSHYGSSEMRWQAFKAAGAVGMIAIPNPKHMEATWARQTATWGAPTISLLDPSMNVYPGMQLSATWNPAGADDLLWRSGHTFAQIMKAEENHEPLPRFASGVMLKAEASIQTRPVPSKNVVAVHQGTDESLKQEFVVVSAHLDHLGMGKSGRGDRVFHGAMDDAAGVGSVIEIARKLKNVSTKRSIVFLALTGEEKGELGSAYFARYPAVKGRIVADLNMDMFLPLFSLKWLEVQGLDESTLGGDVKAVAEASGIKVQADKEPNRNRFIRSDQYSFIKAGVPALAFKFGYQPGDPEEKIFEDWYATRYHTVRDDVKQPVDLQAAAQFNQLLTALLIRVADADAAPKWNEHSFFKRFADSGM